MYEKAIFLMGMARSGTSWVGQIFDSCPDVRYRFQPMFSYEFRGREFSKKLLEEIYESKDAFVSQRNLAEFFGDRSDYAVFAKQDSPRFMVAKMIRFHHLAKHMMQEGKIVYLVRHPCGSINSWLRSPESKDCNGSEEWRTGANKKASEKKKSGVKEYCGFDDWKALTLKYLRLSEQCPDRCRILSYEAMVDNTEQETQKLFDWCGIPFTSQTHEFISLSKGSHSDDPYAVQKDSKRVKNQWQSQLDPNLQNAIINEIKDTPLAKFL